MMETDQQLYDLWCGGDELRAGHALYEAIPNDNRPLWAASILMYAIEESGLALAPVNRVLQIALDDERWHEAHRAFQAVRELTLEAERGDCSDTHVALLFVAEIAAKVTYNASGSWAPFDAESGWWMAKNARHFATVCRNATEGDMWKLLAHERWRRER